MAISGEFPHSIRVKIEFRGKTIRQRVKMTVDKRIMRFNGDNRTKVDLHKLKDDIHLYTRRRLNNLSYRIKFDYNNRTYTIKFKKQTQQKLFKAWIEDNYVPSNYSGSSSATDSQSANNSPDDPALRPQYILPIDMDIRSINEVIRSINEGIRSINEGIREIQRGISDLARSNAEILNMCQQNRGNTRHAQQTILYYYF